MAEPSSRRVEELFHQAVDLDPTQQAAFLDEQCAGDADLRAAVEELVGIDKKARELNLHLRSPLEGMRRTLAAPSPPLPPTIARYRVVRVLGEGGMGTVYEAEQDNPRRTVALKVLRPVLASAPLLKRFAQEVQILGRLHHPGIAQVYDAGVAGEGQPYFAMELITGVPLDRYAREHALDSRGRLELIAKVCDAVQHAHEKGVIHRDLKPGNILVEESGQPKVLDFGVARATDADLATTTAQTEAGQLLGTLAYMSPEQVAADPAAIDRRSDVYALGVMLYELLAHRLPYSLEHLPLPEVALVIREHEPSRLGLIDARLRGDVETIVARALEKDKARRYASAGDLASDIRRYLNNEPIHARPASALYYLRKFARRHKALVGGVLGVIAALAAGAVVSVVYAVRAEHNAQVARVNERQARYQTYRARLAAAGAALSNHDVADAARQLDEAPVEYRGWEWDHLHSRLDDSSGVLRTSADGSVFLQDGPEGLRVGTVTAAGLRVTDPDGRECLTLSLEPVRQASLVQTRDGVWVVEFVGDRVVRLRDEAGRVRAVVDEPGNDIPGVVAVSADGMQMAISWGDTSRGRDVIKVYDTASGKKRAACGGHEGGVWGIAFSPDGSRVASCGEDNKTRLWDTMTGKLIVEMAGHTSKVHCVVFRRDGERLLTASADGTVRQWNVKTGEEAEPPYERHTDEVLAAAYSPDGRLIASGGTDRAVRVWQATDRQDVAVLHGHTADVVGLAFDPGGRRLASLSCKSRVVPAGDGTVRVWEVDPRATLPVLRGHASYVYPVACSPDGQWIASGGWDKTVRLWDARTGEPCKELRHPGAVFTLAFSPDSSWLVSGCDEDDRFRIWSLATGEVQQLIKGPGHRLVGVAVSPDGKTLAACDIQRKMSVYEVATGRAVASGTGSALAYSPDGRWLAGAGEDNKVLCLWDARTLQPSALFAGHTAEIRSVEFSPDGRRLVSAGGSDRTVRVWDVSTGTGRVLEGHTDEVFAAVFHPGGTRVASAGRDRAIWLWDLGSGEEVARLQGHSNYVWSLAFSRDGKTLVSGSGDKTVRLWDTEPLARRHQARREVAALRAEAERLVERLSAELREPARVGARLRGDESLSGPLRRAALQALLRRGQADR
jgi:WD40 repeat protein/predicted Ser/Thr protein kinase